MNRVLVAAGVTVVLVALAGCGSDGGSARAFERMLPRWLGPAQHYDVRVSGASSGRIRAARIEASQLEVEDGLVIEEARLRLENVRYNRDRRELLGLERAEFTGVLLQEDISRHLHRRSSLLKGLSLRITPDGARLRGTADIPGIQLPIAADLTLEGQLGVDDLGRLMFQPQRLRVVGVEVPAVAARLLATQVNPLVDLTGLRLPVHLRSVELGRGEARVTGRVLLREGSDGGF